MNIQTGNIVIYPTAKPIIEDKIIREFNNHVDYNSNNAGLKESPLASFNNNGYHPLAKEMMEEACRKTNS